MGRGASARACWPCTWRRGSIRRGGSRRAVCVAIGGTLWGAHRYRVNQLLAVERVRTRIASDLHDDIGSSLSQIAILSEVVTARVAPAPADIAEPLARIGALSRESVDAMGDIVWAISPDLGTPVHLSQRMRRLASDLLPARGHRLQFESSDEGQVRLGIETRREVFLIFKEALHNVVRHANATDVSIVLTIGRRALHLVVRDNGKGFAAARDVTVTARRPDGCGGDRTGPAQHETARGGHRRPSVDRVGAWRRHDDRARRADPLASVQTRCGRSRAEQASGHGRMDGCQVPACGLPSWKTSATFAKVCGS